MEKNSELLTIKEFAENVGRSQQTIYKQLSTRLAPYVRELDGQKYIDRQALEDVFGAEIQPKENNSFNQDNNPNHPLYAILQAELEAKNRLIEQLQTELAEERKHSREQADKLAVLADQAQQLHAGTIKQQLPDGEPAVVESEPVPAEPERKNFWQKLFGG